MVYIVTFQDPLKDANGVACHMRDLVGGLIKKGVPVQYITPDNNELFLSRLCGLAKWLLPKVARRIKINKEIYLLLTLFLTQLSIRTQINAVKERDAVFNCEDVVSLYALKKSRRRTGRRVYTVHFAIPPWTEFEAAGFFAAGSRYYRFFTKKAKEAFEMDGLRVVTVSESSKSVYRSVQPAFQEFSQELVVIYPGSDAATVDRPVPPVGLNDYVLNVGKVCEGKNQMELARLALELRKKNFLPKFVVVGEIDQLYLQKLKTFLSENGLTDQFIFTGSVERQRVFQYMRSAKLMVHTSTRESFGMSVAESMGSGCPVLAFEYPALKEILSATPEAVLRWEAGTEKNAGIIGKYLGDTQLLEQLKTAQLAFFKKRFGIESMVESFLAVYTK